MSCTNITKHSATSLVDFHVHSTFSPDAEDTIDTMCEAAARAGLAEICFTDHADFEPKDQGHGYLRFETYREAVERASKKWEGTLAVRLGVEADYQTWYAGQVKEFISKRSFDFVLGSVHWVDSLSVTGEVFDTCGVEEACRRYLSAVLDLARSGMCDALAHLDVVKRYAFERYGKVRLRAFSDEIEAVLRALIERGTALEINTSGLRRTIHETLPDYETLELYRHLGGELITFGSDAHRASDVGFAIPYAVDMARSAGFRYITAFRNRQPYFICIG
ncbi:MAG: histidinol-phosphatase [Firmicutes bacterium]|jgi:histidinol-phosphatase (PHP family)|nr:histidinol-phosphatase [Bacillota bacterium]MDH7495431.1 histidinol-phosphatase [Bacillota bacterium]